MNNGRRPVARGPVIVLGSDNTVTVSSWRIDRGTALLLVLRHRVVKTRLKRDVDRGTGGTPGVAVFASRL
jgi:hypothetical protein